MMPVLGSFRFSVVDVFTADALAMQKIARELNLAETAFVLPATREDFAATM